MVDRIGKGGATPPTTGPAAPTQAEKTGKTFDVQKSSESKPVDEVARVTSSPLDQLKAGKIDFDGYLDAKVHEATSHLEGLAPAQIDSIRSMLRDRMSTDPELVDLVKQATGHAPTPSDQEE